MGARRGAGDAGEAVLLHARPGHGHDFAWWSGLTVADAKRAVQLLGQELERCVVGERDYWFAGGPAPARAKSDVAHLLPNYDEYFIGLEDRSAVPVELA